MNKDKFKLVDQFRDDIMDEFIDLCRGNDFNKLTLLKIGDVVDQIYDKQINNLLEKDDKSNINQHEWISIEDKLPEANMRVLAVNSDGDVFLATYVEHKISPSARGYMTWASNMYNSKPTHWMPLPPPPTEKEN